MAEKLATAEGKNIDLDKSDREFAEAMAAPTADEAADYPAPPKRPAPDPDAPFGRTKDGRPKKSAGGRPAKPRTTDGPKKGKAEAPKTDYSLPLAETIDGIWAACAIIPSERAQAQGAILRGNKDNLVTGLNLAAQNNSYARWMVEKVAMGQATWVVLAAMALAPPVLQSIALWQGDKALAAAGLPERAELAASCRRELAAMMSEAQAEMRASVADAAEAEAADELARQDQAHPAA